MADILLHLIAADRSWALQVQNLIQRGLEEKGSVSLDLPPDGGEPGQSEGPGYVVTGIAVCDEPLDERLDTIKLALLDYSVVVDEGMAGQPEVRIGGPDLGRYRVFFDAEEVTPTDAELDRLGFKPEIRQGEPVGAPAIDQLDIGEGPPFRVDAETEGQVRQKLLGAVDKLPANLKIDRLSPIP
jgi:hypothetical protein